MEANHQHVYSTCRKNFGFTIYGNITSNLTVPLVSVTTTVSIHSSVAAGKAQGRQATEGSDDSLLQVYKAGGCGAAGGCTYLTYQVQG